MEDMFSVAYQQTEDLNDLEYAFFGIFDGHGGVEAATYAKEHLLDAIVQQKSFWSDNDEDVLHAIHEGYINTHQAMWKEQVNWKRTSSGLPSTSGTTATVAFIMKSKIYIGHVGDSMLVLGYHDGDEKNWKCLELTKEHKPEAPEEIKRISESGGKVVRKNGVPRVVWNRPKHGHKGPVRRSTAFDEIPFLAVARALGDFWSYNSDLDKFVVSPEPDVGVVEMDTLQHKCLIFGTDGLWNMLSAQDAVDIVQYTERRNETGEEVDSNFWLNPSKCLVDEAIDKWYRSRSRADNTSVVTLLIDPPGPPPRPKTIKKETSGRDSTHQISEDEKLPESGSMAFFTRSPGSPKQELINSLFKHTASLSSVSSSSSKNRAISNILRPYNEIIKAKQAQATESEEKSPSKRGPSPSERPRSPETCSSNSHHNTETSASVATATVSTRSSNSAAGAAQCVSVEARSASLLDSLPSGVKIVIARKQNSTTSGVSSASSTRSSNVAAISSQSVETRSSSTVSSSSSACVSTRSSNSAPTSPSASVGSTRSSNSAASLSPIPTSPSTRSSFLSNLPAGKAFLINRNDFNGTILWKPKTTASAEASTVTSSRSGGRGLATRALSNQSSGCSSSMNSAKRKRFRMDEKRSSLPLSPGFEESSGNSDTENEHDVASASPTLQVATKMKKQKLDQRQPCAASSSSRQGSTSASTRTLRSDTLAAIPVKTLRNRNVNMSPLAEPVRSRSGNGHTPCPRTSTTRSGTMLGQSELRQRSGVPLSGLAESMRSRNRR